MPRTPMFNDDQVQKMRDAYVLGNSSLARVAADFGVSVPTIAKYLRRVGVEVRGRGRPRKSNSETQVSTTIPSSAIEHAVIPNVDVEETFTGDVGEPLREEPSVAPPLFRFDS